MTRLHVEKSPVDVSEVSRDFLVVAMKGEPETWAGKCHGAAVYVNAALGPEDSTVRRGYFIGEIAPGAYFDGRVSQHSWVELRDGRVCDPTRFAFVGGPAWPLWVGPDDDYDIGACKIVGPSGTPPSIDDSEGSPVELNVGSIDYVVDLLGTYTWDRSESGTEDPWLMASKEQIAWLAHLPIKDREGPGVLARWFAAEVYEAIINAGFSALIPIDRRDWILPERSEGRSSF